MKATPRPALAARLPQVTEYLGAKYELPSTHWVGEVTHSQSVANDPAKSVFEPPPKSRKPLGPIQTATVPA